MLISSYPILTLQAPHSKSQQKFFECFIEGTNHSRAHWEGDEKAEIKCLGRKSEESLEIEDFIWRSGSILDKESSEATSSMMQN